VILLAVCELTPKTLAILRSEQTAVFNSRLMYPFFVVASPVTKIIDWFTNGFLFLVNRLHKKEAPGLDKNQLSALISIVSREGIFEKEEKKLIESVLNFAGRELWNIMTPRTKVVSIEKEAPVKEVVRIFKKAKYSKIPVYENTDDNIAGVIYLRDIFHYAHNPEKTSEKKAKDLMEPMYFVPETKRLSEMLEDFRKKKLRIAAVVDEYGSSHGIVTIADVLGEIVGEIIDESFTLENKITGISKDRFLVRGDISLYDFNEYFQSQLASKNYETLAGYVIENAEDIPEVGYSIKIGELKIEIKQRSDKHIEQFIVEKAD
jgi:putative hemolysin